MAANIASHPPFSPADPAAALVLAPPDVLDWLVILPVVWCILAGAALLMLRRRGQGQTALAIAALAVLVGLDAGLLAHVVRDGPATMMMGRWLPPFGIAFTVDLTGALFALTAAIVGLAVAIAALDDVDAASTRYGFHPFLLLLMAGVSGAFLTGDVFNLYVWFEVLLIASFGLISLGARAVQIDGAVKYGFLNLVATTLFLLATAFLYGIFGTLNMADIAGQVPGIFGAPLVTLMALFLVAFGMKAAAFPLQFWLPAAYHTPRIVVSALFAGVLTKVGLYALLRTGIMLLPAQRLELAPVIAVVAIATMLVGALGALAQTDTRRLIGYLVISGIGAMFSGFAIGTSDAVAGAIFYALHSMVVMSALYLAIGLAARLTGSFSLARPGGLFARAPLLSGLCLVLFFSVSGLPPFSGFWPKVLLVRAALESGAGGLAAAILFSGFLTMIATARLFLLVFWKPADAVLDKPLPSPAVLVLPSPAVSPRATMTALLGLTAISIVVGLLPERVLSLVQTAAFTLTDPSAYIGSVFSQGGTP